MTDDLEYTGRLQPNPRLNDKPAGQRAVPYVDGSLPKRFQKASEREIVASTPEGTEDADVVRESLRGRIESALSGVLDDERLRGIIEDALLAEREVWVSCPHCKKRSRAPVADPMARAKAVVFLDQHVSGTPPQRHEVNVTVRQGLPVSELSDQELEALASGSA